MVCFYDGAQENLGLEEKDGSDLPEPILNVHQPTAQNNQQGPVVSGKVQTFGPTSEPRENDRVVLQ